MSVSLIYRENTRGWVTDYAEVLEANIAEVEKAGFSEPEIPILSKTASTFWELPKIAKKQDSEIIHYVANGYAATPRNLAISEKTIITVHDLFSFYQSNRKSQILRYFHNRNLKNADALIAVSEYTKNQIIEKLGINENKIEVIPSAIDIDHYQPKKSEELDLPSNYLLYVGGGYDRKNLEFMLEVHSRLSEEFENLYMVLAGPIGSERQKELEEKAKKEDSYDLIKFTEWIDEEDMPELYSRAKVYLQPSKKEGQGIPPIESMACGTPPVVSDQTALPETVGNNEIVASLDVSDFKNKVKKLLEDPDFYNEIREFGFKRVNHFSKENFIQRHRKIYNSLDNK